jgi:hypothetical protein
LGDAVQVCGYDGIIDQFGRALNFLGQPLAKVFLSVERKEIDALAHVSVAYGVDIGIRGKVLALWGAGRE